SRARRSSSRRCWRPAPSRPSSSIRSSPASTRSSTSSTPRPRARSSRSSAPGIEMGNALFIIWRESAEAMLVVGILYAWLRQHTDMQRGMRYLWGGVAAGLGLALALAAVMLGVARMLSDEGLEYFQVAMML